MTTWLLHTIKASPSGYQKLTPRRTRIQDSIACSNHLVLDDGLGIADLQHREQVPVAAMHAHHFLCALNPSKVTHCVVHSMVWAVPAHLRSVLHYLYLLAGMLANYHHTIRESLEVHQLLCLGQLLGIVLHSAPASTNSIRVLKNVERAHSEQEAAEKTSTSRSGLHRTWDWIFMSRHTFSAAAVPKPGMSMMGITCKQKTRVQTED